MKVRVPDNCFGLDFPDGSRYDANRQGVVEVDDRHHDEMKASIGEGFDFISLGMKFKPISGKVCPRDHFSAFAWQTQCPRCGTELVPDIQN